MIPWLELTQISSNVAIVAAFLWYQKNRDVDIRGISERCHQTQEAGHEAIKELTVQIRKNGGR